MGHFSMEKSPPNGSLLGGNQQRILCHMAIVVGRTIVPPDWTALSERNLGGIDGGSCVVNITPAGFGVPDCSPGVHQFIDQ